MDRSELRRLKQIEGNDLLKRLEKIEDTITKKIDMRMPLTELRNLYDDYLDIHMSGIKIPKERINGSKREPKEYYLKILQTKYEEFSEEERKRSPLVKQRDLQEIERIEVHLLEGMYDHMNSELFKRLIRQYTGLIKNVYGHFIEEKEEYLKLLEEKRDEKLHLEKHLYEIRMRQIAEERGINLDSLM